MTGFKKDRVDTACCPNRHHNNVASCDHTLDAIKLRAAIVIKNFAFHSLSFSTSLSDICWVLTIFELPSASNFNVKRKLASELRDPLPTQTE